jgi:hypothetical protein
LFRKPAKKFSPPSNKEGAMNRNHAAYALVLAASLSGLASAAGIQTDSEVRAMLASEGYSQVSNVKRDGNSWSAEAKAAGSSLKLKIDSDNGRVYPDQEAAQLSPMDVLMSMQSAGYTNIGMVRFYGGVWKASATSSTGHAVEIKVDPADGHVIDEKER